MNYIVKNVIGFLLQKKKNYVVINATKEELWSQTFQCLLVRLFCNVNHAKRCFQQRNILRKMTKFMEEIYKIFLIKKYKEIPFIVFIFSLLTFLIARIASNYFPELHIYINGYHIHHFYYGVVFLLLSSWISIMRHEEKWHRLAAIFLGASLGLMADELGSIAKEFAVHVRSYAYLRNSRHGMSLSWKICL